MKLVIARTRTVVALALAAVVATVLIGCVGPRGTPPVNGLANFDRVDYTRLYRSAQPTAANIEWLHDVVGIRTIINLRQPGDTPPWEPYAVSHYHDMVYTNIPLSGIFAPTKEQMARVIGAIENCPGPVLVHCQWGCERTGVASACWQIHADELNHQEALLNAKMHGMSWVVFNMKHFILTYDGK